MLKALPNILFIVILFLLATAFPLNTEILSLNLSETITEGPATPEVPIDSEYTLHLPEAPDSLQADSIAFTLSEPSAQFEADYLDPYILVISNSRGVVKRVPVQETDYTVESPKPSTRDIHVDKRALTESLTPGYYTIALADSRTADPFGYIWYAGSYDAARTLLKTSGDIEHAFRLYFPTADYTSVVPVTRAVAKPKNKLRELYSELTAGAPKALGLAAEVPPIPYSPNIKISGDSVTVSLYSKAIAPYESAFTVVAESIYRTLLYDSRFESLTLRVDDGARKSVGDCSVNAPFSYSEANRVYLGYAPQEQYILLKPVPIAADSWEERVEWTWKALQLKAVAVSADDVQPVPPSVHLNSYTLNNRQLTLNVSQDFEAVFPKTPDYWELMFKSIVYSYCSFPEVDTVRIQVDGRVPEHAGTDLSQPLSPDPYINLEP